MAVNKYNYFSKNNNRKYCGSSQFKSFIKCSASALAELNEEHEREMTTALLVGSYVDAWFEGTLDAFKTEHPEVFKKDGTLKAEYLQADEIIARVQRDELFMEFMSGRKQVIKTGYIEGIPFKIKIDSYHKGKMIVDLKVVKDFKPIYDEDEGCYLDFIRYWGYDIQAAIYQAVEGNNLPFYICAVTKEKTPDLKVIQIPQSWIDNAMEIIKHNVEMIDMIKHGEIPPIRCEHCDYCKATKKLSRVISAEELLLID
jgi:hypothetical protein